MVPMRLGADLTSYRRHPNRAYVTQAGLGQSEPRNWSTAVAIAVLLGGLWLLSR